MLAVKVIMRAWKNYLLQRKYRNVLEDFRRKVFQANIKKYKDSRIEILLDIKDIQSDMTLCDKAVTYLRGRIKLIETFEAQGIFEYLAVY